MRILLLGAIIASAYGGYTAIRHKAPLFYTILCLAMISCLMGCVYSVLYDVLWISGDTGFHVGYLGFAGMFFFLFSSYYGAIDSLADGGEPALHTYRILAGGVALVHFAVSVCGVALLHKGWWLLVLIVPMSGTLYFAVKHLLIPDVEMGIIRVLRPYNALVCVLCVGMMLFVLTGGISGLYTACSVVCAVLLIVSIKQYVKCLRKYAILNLSMMVRRQCLQ